MLDTARQAQKHQCNKQDDEDLVVATEKWRDAGRQAASYLFNQAREKVERMGGMEEYLRRQKEQDEFQNQTPGFDEGEIDFDSLTPDEKERYEELKEEYEEELKKGKELREEEEEKEEVPTDFTIKYMLKSIKVDAELLFPDGFDT